MLPLNFRDGVLYLEEGNPLYTKVQQSVDGMVRVVREDVIGIRVIKALSKGEYEHVRYDMVNTALIKDETRASVTMGLANPIMTMLMNFGIVGVVALAASRVQDGRSDRGRTVIAFMQYFTLISICDDVGYENIRDVH